MPPVHWPGPWRWVEIPTYGQLTQADLERKLRAKFGNYKFFTNVREGRHKVQLDVAG
jgi:hypothetical protein